MIILSIDSKYIPEKKEKNLLYLQEKKKERKTCTQDNK